MLDAPPPPPAAAGEEESACRSILSEFMTRVARFEELAEVGKRLLVRFQQELEYFRRPQIPSESDVMREIVKSNCTDRMRSYLEAGCRPHCQDISNINRLRSCEDGLKDHINKVKTLLEELEHLVKDIYGSTLRASLSALDVSDCRSIDNRLTNESCFIEQKKQEAEQLDSDVSLVTTMVIVHNMLKLDYMMQEKIVRALSLKKPSSELEGYCLMWDLRPYIDDNVMHIAWKMCP
ncbi:hypothetical protein ACP70R_023638 [Stipagrostis hirtigluma subsp. patula]